MHTYKNILNPVLNTRFESAFSRTWAEINLDVLISNFHSIKKIVGNEIKILIPVKADAYGHGAVEIASCLEKEGAYAFGVASCEEGRELRDGGVKSKILVLSPVLSEEVDFIINYALTPTVSFFEFAKTLSERAGSFNRKIPVHVEVDTGMSRTGIQFDNAIELVNKLKRLKWIELEGIFTHFPVAGMKKDTEFTKRQIGKFSNLLSSLRKSGINFSLVHSANSAGVLFFKDSFFNMVRPGLIVYGIFPQKVKDNTEIFSPVMSLLTRVTDIRTIRKGMGVSYGHTYVAKKEERIATLSVGYGDGYSFQLSNSGEVLIHCKRAPIRGRVCMDLTMISVSHIPKVKVGDKVVLFGSQEKEVLSVEEVAEWGGTISYEVLCSVGPRVPRVYIKGGKVIAIRKMTGK